MGNFLAAALAVAMVGAFLLGVVGVKLVLARQTRGRGILTDCRGSRARHERDDLDGVAGLIGSVASRMSR